jgi:hypothetical protein
VSTKNVLTVLTVLIVLIVLTMNYADQATFWSTQINDETVDVPTDEPVQPVVHSNVLEQATVLTIEQRLLQLPLVAENTFSTQIALVEHAVRTNKPVPNIRQSLEDQHLLTKVADGAKSFWCALCVAIGFDQSPESATAMATLMTDFVINNHNHEIVMECALLSDEAKNYVSNVLRRDITVYSKKVENSPVPEAYRQNIITAISAINAYTSNMVVTLDAVVNFVCAYFLRSNIHVLVYTITPPQPARQGRRPQPAQLAKLELWRGEWPNTPVHGGVYPADHTQCICLLMTGDQYTRQFDVINMPAAQPVAPARMMGGAHRIAKRVKFDHSNTTTSVNNAAHASYKHEYVRPNKPNDHDKRLVKRAKIDTIQAGQHRAVQLYQNAVAAWRHACMLTSQPASPFGTRFNRFKHCRPADMTDFAKYVDWAYRRVVLQGTGLPEQLAAKHDKLVAKYVGADLSASLVLKECRTLVVEIMAGKAVFRYLATTNIPTFCWLVSPMLYKRVSQNDQHVQTRWLAKQAKTTKLFDRQDHQTGPTRLVQTKQLVSTAKHADQMPVLWLDKSTSQKVPTFDAHMAQPTKRAKHNHVNKHAKDMWQAVLYCQDRKVVASQLAFANQSKSAQLPNLAAMLAKMPDFFWKDLLGWKSKLMDFDILAKLVMIG